MVLLGTVKLIPILVVYSRRVLSGPVLRGTLHLELLKEPIVSGGGSFGKVVLGCPLPIFKALFMRVKV
jgi:hypothetical protein